MAKRSRWKAVQRGSDGADIWLLSDGRGVELRLGSVTAAEAKRAAGRMSREAARGRGEYIRAWHREHFESAVGYLTGDAPDEQPPPRTATDSMRLAQPGFDVIARHIADAQRGRFPHQVPPNVTLDELAATEAYAYSESFALSLIGRGYASDVARLEADILGCHLHYAVNYELHRRKTFWVDAPLAWALARTDLGVPAELLKLPFPACAFVFDDPRTLELAHRLYRYEATAPKRETRVVTVYLADIDTPEGRGIFAHVCLDGLDGQWPYLVSRNLRIDGAGDLAGLLASHFPIISPEALDPVFQSPELHDLLHLVFNAVLYATSAGVEIREVPSPARKAREAIRRATGRAQRTARRRVERMLRSGTAEDVFFLPGRIEIRQAAEADGEGTFGEGAGSSPSTRFMVRGHWRRANSSWKDQRPRWIEPYWKGPDMAAVVERSYRLTVPKR